MPFKGGAELCALSQVTSYSSRHVGYSVGAVPTDVEMQQNMPLMKKHCIHFALIQVTAHLLMATADRTGIG